MFEKRRASTGASFFVPEILTMVEHVVSSFLGHLEKEKRASKHTLRNYEVDLNQCQQFLADTYESSLVEMQGDWLRSWVVSMVQEGKRPKTIHRKISACRTFVKYALASRVDGFRPHGGCGLAQVGQADPRGGA